MTKRRLAARPETISAGGTEALLGAASVHLFGAEPGKLPAQLYDVLARTTDNATWAGGCAGPLLGVRRPLQLLGAAGVPTGIAQARRRLGGQAERVHWLIAGLLAWQPQLLRPRRPAAALGPACPCPGDRRLRAA